MCKWLYQTVRLCSTWVPLYTDMICLWAKLHQLGIKCCCKRISWYKQRLCSCIGSCANCAWCHGCNKLWFSLTAMELIGPEWQSSSAWKERVYSVMLRPATSWRNGLFNDFLPSKFFTPLRCQKNKQSTWVIHMKMTTHVIERLFCGMVF